MKRDAKKNLSCMMQEIDSVIHRLNPAFPAAKVTMHCADICPMSWVVSFRHLDDVTKARSIWEAGVCVMWSEINGYRVMNSATTKYTTFPQLSSAIQYAEKLLKAAFKRKIKT